MDRVRSRFAAACAALAALLAASAAAPAAPGAPGAPGRSAADLRGAAVPGADNPPSTAPPPPAAGGAGGAGPREPEPPAPPGGAASGSAPAGAGESPIDGFAIGYVPEGAGASAGDTEYEWGGAAFTQRVWETRLPSGGYRPGMQVLVVRGGHLDSLEALRGFLAEYHERDPADWPLEPFDRAEGPGLIGTAEVFWLVQPGTAVEVRDPSGALGRAELARTAEHIRSR
ncbi:hypothetical protein [Nocardiopsis coralliicola]